jgi:hypothetical protein
MKNRHIGICGFVAVLGMASVVQGKAQTRPADVRAGHWAEKSVVQALDNRLLTLENGKFRGESKVTKTQAVIALAALAKSLEQGNWKRLNSAMISTKSETMVERTAWEKQNVSRYTLSFVLSKFGNYFVNGVQRADKNAKDVAKSGAFPQKPTITLAKTHPAYASLTYLVGKNMIRPGSALLKPDNTPLRANDLSVAVSEMAIGLTNQVTELGLDEDGGTPDKSFKNKKKP